MEEQKVMTRKQWDKIVLKKRKSGYKQTCGKFRPASVHSFSLIPFVFVSKQQLT